MLSGHHQAATQLQFQRSIPPACQPHMLHPELILQPHPDCCVPCWGKLPAAFAGLATQQATAMTPSQHQGMPAASYTPLTTHPASPAALVALHCAVPCCDPPRPLRPVSECISPLLCWSPPPCAPVPCRAVPCCAPPPPPHQCLHVLHHCCCCCRSCLVQWRVAVTPLDVQPGMTNLNQHTSLGRHDKVKGIRERGSKRKNGGKRA